MSCKPAEAHDVEPQALDDTQVTQTVAERDDEVVGAHGAGSMDGAIEVAVGVEVAGLHAHDRLSVCIGVDRDRGPESAVPVAFQQIQLRGARRHHEVLDPTVEDVGGDELEQAVRTARVEHGRLEHRGCGRMPGIGDKKQEERHPREASNGRTHDIALTGDDAGA